jgi:hypothetical protein
MSPVLSVDRQRGTLLGLAIGDGEKRQFDTIYFGDKVTTAGHTSSHSVTAAECEVTDSAWLLRPALAKSLMPEPEVVVAGGGEGKPKPEIPEGGEKEEEEWGGEKEVVIKEGERRLNRVRITMTVPWENWNDVYNEVIDPLAKEGAEVRCDVVIVAKGDAAIRENTVELGIRESLDQRGIKADIQTG